MNIILFDTEDRKQLFPLTLTRAVAEIRMGILTMRERWEKLASTKVFVLTEEYLQQLYENIPTGDYIFIDARVIPTTELATLILKLHEGNAIRDERGVIAGRLTVDSEPLYATIQDQFDKVQEMPVIPRVEFSVNIFQRNADLLQFDYNLLTKRRVSANTNDSVFLIKASRIFIEEGADISYAILNATTGPIYIGKNATIMENCSIRGPFALGEGGVLKMGTRVYGATTVGPYCTGGGEIKNSVMMGYSNKGHDGYLGDSVIGEWCNLGAGTSNSNVKNTGGDVNVWDYQSQAYISSGFKAGVIMGDYTRTAINTSVNTGTVAGVCANVFGEGLTPKFIPDFAWGSNGKTAYEFDKVLKDISNWKKMKNKSLSEVETQVLKHIFDRRSNA